jgi:murein L,D-transpeptidase YcbB/YkuD
VAASTKKVNFSTPLPVHLTYQSAWVGDSGVTYFREDIYNHDKRAISQLENNRATPESAESSAIASTGITLASNGY